MESPMESMNPGIETTVPPEVLRTLLDERGRFLAFLERRTGSRELAEDLLHEAYLRGMERLSELRDDESAVAWFYRVLRNSLADHWRHRDVERRAADRLKAEAGEEEPAADPELLQEVCRCIEGVVETLKPEYAEAIRRVDLGGASVSAFAEATGITPGNASVRLHRAHAALKQRLLATCGACATHGCLDCHCHDGHGC
jgi:RNA polymerase sigma factor (sigma-70 family)